MWASDAWADDAWALTAWLQPLAAPTIQVDGGSSINLYVGRTYQLSADADGDPVPTVSWASDNEAVATVDQDGTVTGVALGTCTITATATNSEGSANDSVTAHVRNLPTPPVGGDRVIRRMRERRVDV